MRLTEYYKRAMKYDSYLDQLGENTDLHRLHYKKYTVSDSIEQQIKNINRQRILVITEPWCSDSLALLPVIHKIVESAPDWELKVLLRDENPDIMAYFLTNGSSGIPVFIFLDDQDQVLFKFGPRPVAAQQIFDNNREAIMEGKMERQEVIKKIRTFYAKDRGRSIEEELSLHIAQHFPKDKRTLQEKI